MLRTGNLDDGWVGEKSSTGNNIDYANQEMVEIEEEMIESQELEGWEKIMGDDIIL